MLRDIETLTEINLSVENQKNLRIDLQHTYVIDREGCAISTGRLGDWLSKLSKA